MVAGPKEILATPDCRITSGCDSDKLASTETVKIVAFSYLAMHRPRLVLDATFTKIP